MDKYSDINKSFSLSNYHVLFFDTEFTGLVKNTDLISIGIVDSLTDDVFYAEFTDYNEELIDKWLEDNVIANLNIDKDIILDNNFSIKGDTKYIVDKLLYWLDKIGSNKPFLFISDCMSYDWVLFNELFGGAKSIPENIFYIPYDICTLFMERGIDPDINREEYAEIEDMEGKHNSLHDAKVIKKCFNKLVK